jgi:hypothetical protein
MNEMYQGAPVKGDTDIAAGTVIATFNSSGLPAIRCRWRFLAALR